MARTCTKALDYGNWSSCISLPTRIWLCNVYILPVLMYSADVWSLTVHPRNTWMHLINGACGTFSTSHTHISNSKVILHKNWPATGYNTYQRETTHVRPLGSCWPSPRSQLCIASISWHTYKLETAERLLSSDMAENYHWWSQTSASWSTEKHKIVLCGERLLKQLCLGSGCAS